MSVSIRKDPNRLFILMLVITLLQVFCSPIHMVDSDKQGNGSETVARGYIRDSAGAPVVGAPVYLLPVSFKPDFADVNGPNSMTLTNDSGAYEFTNISAGLYNVEALDPANRSGVIIQNINIIDTAKVISVGASIPVQLAKIVISFPNMPLHAGDYLSLRGTTAFSVIDSQAVKSTTAGLDGVPAGKYSTLNYVRSADSLSINVLNDSLTVSAGASDSITVTKALAKYSRNVYLNTTASGANVMANMLQFPMVIRLTGNNFNFSEASADGSDLRFTKSNGQPVPYEIERWDPVAGMAEVWVKVDTVFGNDSSHYIAMFWGASISPKTMVSNGASVFDTTDGWAGVWHLPENAPDTLASALYRNSVENANYGDDKVLSNGKTGMIGLGQNFTWLTKASVVPGDRIQVPNASARLKPQQVTLSGWMQVFQSDSSGSEMASMGDNYLIRVDSVRVRFVIYTPSSPYYIVCYDSSADFVDSSWHYYAGSYDGKEARLYVDGALRSVEPFTLPVDYSRGPDFVMGSHGTHQSKFDLNGNLDEIEVSSVARSADWIKLMYENQRANGRFISTAP
jgi:Concanavalin A-like lectin/glucanases superfamily/Domain of unknown function (DUF2341)